MATNTELDTCEIVEIFQEAKMPKKQVFKCPSNIKIVRKLTFHEKEEQKNLQKFFERVRNTPPMVDCKPPRLNVEFITRVGKLRANDIVLKHRVIANKKMAENINIINRTTGTVVCHNPNYVPTCKIDSRRPEAVYIAKANRHIFERLIRAEANYKYATLQKEWERNEKLIICSSKFPPHWLLEESGDPNDKITKQLNCELDSKNYSPLKKQKMRNVMRPRVFLDIEGSDGRQFGRMVIVLYRDIVPLTATNFLSLCMGTNSERLTYKNTPFFRINTHLYCLGGDVTSKYGLGGRSIYGDLFDHENYELKHSRPGMLTMHSQGAKSGNSQFMITFQALPTLNGKSVVFGRVIKGLDTLFCIEEFGTRTGKPKMELIISNCGAFNQPTKDTLSKKNT